MTKVYSAKIRTVDIRLKTFGDDYNVVPVALDGRLPDFPYDVRNAFIHPDDEHLLEKLNLPDSMHETNYEIVSCYKA